MSLTINDPRSKLDVGHFFNSRAIRKTHNVVLEPFQALIYTKEGQLLSESTSWPIANVLISYPWLPKGARRLDIDAGVPLSSNSFYHWLIEDLPGTISAMESNPNFPILISSAAPRYVQDFIKISKRSYLSIRNPVNVGTLISTEKRTDAGWPHPKDIEVLERFQEQNFQPPKNSNDKIYVSRRFSRRSPKNENAVEALFTDYGFKIVYNERLDLSSQIQMFSGASHIAGIHGAGLSNMVWAKPGTRILEIANSQLWNECFHRLASIKQLNYDYLIYDGEINQEIDLIKLKEKLVKLNYCRG